MAKERDVVLKLKVKPATAADLKKAFSGVSDAAKQAGSTGGVSNAFKGLTQSFADPGGAIKKGISDLADSFDGLGEEAATLLSSLDPLAVAMGLVVAVAATLYESFKGLLATVSKANPAAVTRLQYAWDDLEAVIGHTLTPVVELLTDATRLFGDVLASILPSTDEVRDALSPLQGMLGDLRDIFAELAPVLRDLVSLGLKALRIELEFLTGVFHGLVTAIHAILPGFGRGPLRSSVGAAAREIQFTTQDAAAKSIYQAAYLASRGGKQGPTDSEVLANILKDVDAILAWLTKGQAAAGGAAGAFAGGIGAVVAAGIGGQR